MVRNEEILLPSHEQMLFLCKVFENKSWRPGLFLIRSKGGKPTPMLHVYLFGRPPFGMCCFEAVFGADYLSFEAGRQRRVVVGEA